MNYTKNWHNWVKYFPVFGAKIFRRSKFYDKRRQNMEYQQLRGTGMTVSRLSLGTMTFGAQTDEAASIRMVDMAIDAGVNFIDTADIYVRGVSEQLLGKALKGKRDKVVVASKVCNFVGEDRIKDSGLHRWHVIRGVESSLKRLNTDCLDICYLHRPDGKTPIEETLAAFDTLVQQGKVIYVGMSNFAAWQICEALWKSAANRWTPPVVTQVPYNIFTRSIEQELVPFSNKMDIGITVYNPLAAGLLTGKHSKVHGPLEGTRFAMNKEYLGRYWLDSNLNAVEALRSIAADAGKSMTELAFQWLLSQPHVDSIILGASKLEHLEENLKAAEGRLDSDTLAACDEIWQRLRGDHFRYNR
jgi:aryl-alcohol dehydrogenase-like predicted oxidoreductase